MEVTLNSEVIIGIAGLITSLGVIFGFIISLVKQIQKWNAYDKKISDVNDEIKELKKDQFLQIETERAILDGLHQLGCNGRTTEASEKLDDYLLRKAFDQKTTV